MISKLISLKIIIELETSISKDLNKFSKSFNCKSVGK